MRKFSCWFRKHDWVVDDVLSSRLLAVRSDRMPDQYFGEATHLNGCIDPNIVIKSDPIKNRNPMLQETINCHCERCGIDSTINYSMFEFM